MQRDVLLVSIDDLESIDTDPHADTPLLICLDDRAEIGAPKTALITADRALELRVTRFARELH